MTDYTAWSKDALVKLAKKQHHAIELCLGVLGTISGDLGPHVKPKTVDDAGRMARQVIKKVVGIK